MKTFCGIKRKDKNTKQNIKSHNNSNHSNVQDAIVKSNDT